METIVNGVLTNYKIVNPEAKKYCLILHGWGHSGDLWSTLASKLPRDFGYILLDLPGFGGSQHLASGASVPEYSQFVINFLDKLKIKKTVILGHSFGGQIGADLAIKKPSVVDKLILVGAAVIRNKTVKQRVKVWFYSQFKPIKAILPKKVVEFIYRKISSSDYYGASEEKREILKKINNYHLVKDLDKIECPTLIVWGENDKEIPNTSKTLASKIPLGRLKIIYGAGHNAYLEKGEEMAQMISNFLAK